MRLISVLIFAFILAPCGYAQIEFTPAAKDLTREFRSGVAVMITDVNGDGIDDLVRLKEGKELVVTLQGQDGRLLTTYSQQFAQNAQWNLTGGDLDNSGGFDILTSGVYDRVKIFRPIPFSPDYSMEIIDDPTFFAQASNMVDINNDGYLDLFVCNDHGANIIYINDGTGALWRDDMIIDFTTDPPSDNSGNYGSVWIDIDGDGDLDLYISKCRASANSPTDPRRINVLFINNGDGTFTEQAGTFGLSTGAQSWAAAFGDIDNDGDLDVVVLNHDVPSELYENIDNSFFTPITAGSGIDISGVPMQAVFADFDNDGLVDLLVGGTVARLFRNLGDLRFEIVSAPFDGQLLISFAIGDLNGDGFLDVYGTKNELYNNPSDVRDDVLWLNTPNGNNYVRLHLRGTESNRNAVGARVTIYGAWGMQFREVRAGESYGITNSLIQHFGLGTADRIDSLVILWPGGLHEVHTLPPINTLLLVEEGGCVTTPADLGQGPYTQCGDDEFLLIAPDGFAQYLWSTGDTTSQIITALPGVHHVHMRDDGGCLHIGGPVLISPNTDPDTVSVEVGRFDIVCAGSQVVLSGPENALEYHWSNGETTPSITVENSGTFSVLAAFACGSVQSDSVVITFIDPDQFSVLNDTLTGPGSGQLFADADSVLWYDEHTGTTPVGSGPVFMTPHVDSTTTFYARNFSRIAGEQYTAGQKAHTGNTRYHAGAFNGAMRFDVLERFRLDSVRVFTEFPGDRTILIITAEEDTIYRRTFAVDSGMTVLPLDVWLLPGDEYLMTTDINTNQEVFGVNSPRLFRSDGGFLYPFEVRDIVRITGTQAGTGFYYYFYDWRITASDRFCISGLRPAMVVVDSVSAVHNLRRSFIRLYPNPAGSVLTAGTPDLLKAAERIDIFDISGRRASGWTVDRMHGTIDIGALAPGLYHIDLAVNGLLYTGRFVRM